MSTQHYVRPSSQSVDALPVRLGAGTGSANNLSFADSGKLVKFVGESRYDLCVAGDPIEAQIVSIENATSGGYTIGGINRCDRFYARADGLEATPGTGTINPGDYVVAGSITAKGTALTDFPKVCKATVQPGDVPATLTAAAAQIKASLHAVRVVSVLTGAGAVGTQIVCEFVQRAPQ